MNSYHDLLGRYDQTLKEATRINKEVQGVQGTILRELEQNLDPYSKQAWGIFTTGGKVLKVFSFAEEEVGDSDLYFVFCEGKWLWIKRGVSYHEIYPCDVVEGKPPPFDTAAVEKVLLDLGKKWGVEVIPNPCSYVKITPWDKCNQPKQLTLLHPGAKILGSGVILHMGSDIGSPWAVLETSEGIYIYYSGWCSYTHRIEPGGSVQKFLEYISDPNRKCDGMTPELRSKLEGLVK